MNESIKKMVDAYQSPLSQTTKLREVIQHAALLGLERSGFFSKAAFYGGTALRILYGLDRFSEDLDFTLLKAEENFDVQPYLQALERELNSFGFKLNISKKEKSLKTSVQSAFLKINTMEFLLAIGDEKGSKKTNHNEKIQIKLEIDTQPIPDFRVQNRLVINPLPFYVLTLHPGDLFAGKMLAILYRAWKGRVKGRDWYDLNWYIQQRIPLHLKPLQTLMQQTGQLSSDQTLTKEALIHLIKAKIATIQWEDAKQDMRGFITDPKRLDIWSAHFFSDLIDYLEVE